MASDNMPAAQATYSGFLNLMKYGTIAAIILTAIVILIIA